MSPARKKYLYIIIIALAIPILIEAGSRIVYSVRTGDLSYLVYPFGAPLGVVTVKSRHTDHFIPPGNDFPPMPPMHSGEGELEDKLMFDPNRPHDPENAGPAHPDPQGPHHIDPPFHVQGHGDAPPHFGEGPDPLTNMPGGIQSDRLRMDPGMHEFMVGGKVLHSIPINSSGYRGKDFSKQKEAKYCVVTLGGSSTFSAECPPGHSYPEILEKLWNENHRTKNVEVINRAAVGIDLEEVGLIFKGQVIAAVPDLVTVCSAFNSAKKPALVDLRPQSSPPHQRALWEKSLFYTALFNRFAAKDSETVSDDEMRIKKYKNNLLDIIEAAKQNNIKLLFILQPMLNPDLVRKEMIAERLKGLKIDFLLEVFRSKFELQGRLCTIMEQVAKENGIPFIDPRTELTGAVNPEDNFWISLHLTPKGSLRLAREIVKKVDEKYMGLDGLLKN